MRQGRAREIHVRSAVEATKGAEVVILAVPYAAVDGRRRRTDAREEELRRQPRPGRFLARMKEAVKLDHAGSASGVE